MPCPPGTEQRLRYKDGSVCVTNDFAAFLGCVDTIKAEEIKRDARDHLAGQVNASSSGLGAKAEAEAVGGFRVKYSTNADVKDCFKQYDDALKRKGDAELKKRFAGEWTGTFKAEATGHKEHGSVALHISDDGKLRGQIRNEDDDPSVADLVGTMGGAISVSGNVDGSYSYTEDTPVPPDQSVSAGSKGQYTFQGIVVAHCDGSLTGHLDVREEPQSITFELRRKK